MTLTTKELLLLQDNIRMIENSINFMSGSASMCSDSQIRNMLNSMSREHANDLQSLAKYISNPNLQ